MADNTETIDSAVLSDDKTGHKFFPVTSFNNLKDLPDLLTADNVNVKDGYVGNPPSGPRVISWEYFNSKVVTINNFRILYFYCTVTIDKAMFSAPWGYGDRVLFHFPDDFDPNNTGHYSVQEMVGRIEGSTNQLGFNFREMGHVIVFDGIQNGSGIDVNSLPDKVTLELNGSFNKY